MLDHRIAGAPISWGVSEVPGWGYQLPAGLVLTQMHRVGLVATEFGPDGFLPSSADSKASMLQHYGLRAVGGFLPVLLHDDHHDPIPEVDSFIDSLLASGAQVAVLAAFSGTDGYDERVQLDDNQWTTMLANLNRINEQAEKRGIVAAIHPHVGTVIESADDVERVLEGGQTGLCLDTGHLLVAGADPVAIARRFAGRVVHVHLKDVDQQLAEQVRKKETSFAEAVSTGLFKILGQGDVDIRDLVNILESSGYRGWYVLEQDLRLAAEPTSEGPTVNVRSSLAYLREAVS